MIDEQPVFFAETRAVAGLEPIAGAAPVGPPVAGIDFIAPLVCDPRNTAPAMAPKAGGLLAQGLPDGGGSFDWRSHAKLAPVGQQGKCGGCWAFAVAGSLSDRQAVVTKGDNPDLSPMEMLTCAQSCQPACGTCSPEQGFSYAKKHGVPGGGTSKSCLSTLGVAEPPSCSDAKATCTAAAALRVYAGSDAATASSITQIKKEIAERGPVCAVYRVYRDFIVGSDPKRGRPAFEETGGVYVHVDLHPSAYAPPGTSDKTLKNLGDLVGYHAVVIVGWGTQDVPHVPGSERGAKESLSYWIVRNSWGDTWGDKGYFKCAMGTSRVNQSVAMDLPISVTQQGQRSKFGGVFFAPVKGVHGSALLLLPCFFGKPVPPSGTKTVVVLIAFAVALILLVFALRVRTLARQGPWPYRRCLEGLR